MVRRRGGGDRVQVSNERYLHCAGRVVVQAKHYDRRQCWLEEQEQPHAADPSAAHVGETRRCHLQQWAHVHLHTGAGLGQRLQLTFHICFVFILYSTDVSSN